MAKPTALDTLNDALGLAGDDNGADTGGTEHESEGASEDEGGDEGSDDAGGEEDGLSEEESGESEDSDGDESEEGDDEEVEGEEEASEEEGDGERNPDGTFKKKGEEKAAEKPGEKKKPDAVNDPLPKDLKQETRERMQTLINTAKELTAERDKVRTDFGTFVGGLQAANVTPQQYGETLSWLSLFNSGVPAQQEKALELIEGIADRLATMLGKSRTVNDPLQGHQDLVAAIQAGKVTKEYAAEIARTRNQAGFTRQLNENATQQQQQQQAQQTELNNARSELHTLEETLRQTDPDYERKKSILVAALKPIMRALPPSQWKEKFLESYRAIKLGSAGRTASAKPKNRGAPKNQPLRAGKQPAGGQARQAGSALDAMSAALSNMGK